MHWFNPFLLKCSGKISEDCELSCDEAVIRRLPLSGRVAYGDTLVAALTDLNMPPEWGPAVGLCENAGIDEREVIRYYEISKTDSGRENNSNRFVGCPDADRFCLRRFYLCRGGGGVTRAGETVPFVGEGTISGSPWKGGLTSSSYFNNGYYIQLIWNYPSGSDYRIKEVTAGDTVFQVAFSELTEPLSGIRLLWKRCGFVCRSRSSGRLIQEELDSGKRIIGWKGHWFIIWKALIHRHRMNWR